MDCKNCKHKLYCLASDDYIKGSQNYLIPKLSLIDPTRCLSFIHQYKLNNEGIDWKLLREVK